MSASQSLPGELRRFTRDKPSVETKSNEASGSGEVPVERDRYRRPELHSLSTSRMSTSASAPVGGPFQLRASSPDAIDELNEQVSVPANRASPVPAASVEERTDGGSTTTRSATPPPETPDPGNTATPGGIGIAPMSPESDSLPSRHKTTLERFTDFFTPPAKKSPYQTKMKSGASTSQLPSITEAQTDTPATPSLPSSQSEASQLEAGATPEAAPSIRVTQPTPRRVPAYPTGPRLQPVPEDPDTSAASPNAAPSPTSPVTPSTRGRPATAESRTPSQTTSRLRRLLRPSTASSQQSRSTRPGTGTSQQSRSTRPSTGTSQRTRSDRPSTSGTTAVESEEYESESSFGAPYPPRWSEESAMRPRTSDLQEQEPEVRSDPKRMCMVQEEPLNLSLSRTSSATNKPTADDLGSSGPEPVAESSAQTARRAKRRSLSRASSLTPHGSRSGSTPRKESTTQDNSHDADESAPPTPVQMKEKPLPPLPPPGSFESPRQAPHPPLNQGIRPGEATRTTETTQTTQTVQEHLYPPQPQYGSHGPRSSNDTSSLRPYSWTDEVGGCGERTCCIVA